MAEEVLVQVPVWHPLEDKALGLVLADHAQQTHDVRVPQVRHHLGLTLEVAPCRLHSLSLNQQCKYFWWSIKYFLHLVSAWFERLDSYEGGDAAHDPAELAAVHLAEHAVTHLVHEPAPANQR